MSKKQPDVNEAEIHGQVANSKTWYRLDNAANLFPAVQSSRITTVFRISMTLTSLIDPAKLQISIEALMPRFPYWNVRLLRGFFWYYLEKNNFRPKVNKDVKYPNGRLHPRMGTHHMFRVRYYQKRIAVEFSHVLTDGSGAMAYLKALVFDYLRRIGEDAGEPDELAYPNSIPTEDEAMHAEEDEDAYRRFYDRPLPLPSKGRPSFHPVGRMLNPDVYLITTGVSPMGPAISAAKRLGVSLTVLLTSVYIDVMQELQISEGIPIKRRRPISISVPVNLRTIWPTRTMRNFTLFVSPSIDPRLGVYNFDEILLIVKNFLATEVNAKSLSRQISRNVGGQSSLFVRAMPLFIKKILSPLLYTRMGESLYSGTISNIGLVALPKKMQHLVERIDFIPCPNPVNRTNLSMVGYNGYLFMNFGRIIKENSVEAGFFRRLVKMGIPVKVEVNA